jgi:hypothetical protein
MEEDSGRAGIATRLGLLTASPDANGCRRFMGGKDADGYGLFWAGGKMRRAHQVAWEIAYARDWPRGKVARHSCNVRDCVNAFHIRPGTAKENRMDVVASGNDPRANQTHCKRGHPLSGDNLILRRRQRGEYRVCRECQKASDAKYRQRRNERTIDA